MSPHHGRLRRVYLASLLLRACLALLPLSILHPDEWMQSAQTMATRADGVTPLAPGVEVPWDWSFTCVDESHPAHTDEALRAWRHDDRELDRLGRRRCPEGMEVQKPIRGVAAPWLSCGLPYQLWSQLSGSEITPTMLFLLPRVNQLVWSLITDFFLFTAARIWYPVLAWSILCSSSFTFPALVMMSRTFTNSTEATLLAAALALAATADQRSGKLAARTLLTTCTIFGALVGVGAPVRPSFLFFAWPIGVLLIRRHCDLQAESRALAQMVRSTIVVAAWIVIPAVCTFYALVIADSLYYETLWVCDGSSHDSCTSGIRPAMRLVVKCAMELRWPTVQGSHLFTLLNNLVYNSHTSNVAHHGLHPRYTHVVVNMVVLFGPVRYWRLLQTTYFACRQWQARWRREPTADTFRLADDTHLDASKHTPSVVSSSHIRHRGSVARSSLISSSSSGLDQSSPARHLAAHHSATVSDALLLAVCWSGVLLLSVIPHQEFRFLLPCFIPISLLARERPAEQKVDADQPEREQSTHTHTDKHGSLRFRRCRRFSSLLSLVHTVFTVCLLGVLHQGGLLRQWMSDPPVAIDAQTMRTARSVIYMHTYTTPTAFLRAGDLQGASMSAIASVIDVHRLDQLPGAVERSLAAQRASRIGSNASEYLVRLVLPGSVPFPLSTLRALLTRLAPASSSSTCAHRVCIAARCHTVWPHISLDDAPNLLAPRTHPPTEADVRYVCDESIATTAHATTACRPCATHTFAPLSLISYDWYIPMS